MPFNYISPLLRASQSKIVLLVMDGLGGLPMEAGGPTELESAHTPNMDRLATEGMVGLSLPIRPGITPGSGPAHLALFGYDPLQYEIGRGVLESVGVGLQVHRGDVAARGNFVTLDPAGNIADRRAGRISSGEAYPLVERLKEIRLPGVETEVRQVKEYRFAVVMRGAELNPDIDDTDPQSTGVPPLDVTARTPAAERTAGLFNQWIEQARHTLVDHPKANGLTLRGFATDPNLPSFQQAYGVNPACVSVYPMYRGVAQLVGMQAIQFSGEAPEDEFAALGSAWNDYDFFFVHVKQTDSKGEDGDFAGKAKVIEGVDAALPRLLELKPDVLIITGDHSTPARLRTHSWHPVPFLLWAPATVRPDEQTRFGERACARGGLGTFPALDVMPLALAHAGRLEKFGA
ncbi:MAG TPA: 2,3-bisphosphoglycerate-independent phosphoglycerate mutase [Anaerolineales bacterium]|nr:2,3-bisphosphoglycerate-independent phosphoglycerate mutase [Anaerolineales bacterium]